MAIAETFASSGGGYEKILSYLDGFLDKSFLQLDGGPKVSHQIPKFNHSISSVKIFVACFTKVGMVGRKITPLTIIPF